MDSNRIITVRELFERVENHQLYDSYIRFGKFSDDDNFTFKLIINDDEEFKRIYNKLRSIYNELMLDSRLLLTIQLLDYAINNFSNEKTHKVFSRICDVGSDMYIFHTKHTFLNELYELVDGDDIKIKFINKQKLNADNTYPLTGIPDEPYNM